MGISAANSNNLNEAMSKMPSLDSVLFTPQSFQLERKNADGERYDIHTPTVLGDTFSVFTIPVTNYRQNCRIVRCEASGETVVIDPGGAADTISEFVQSNAMNVSQIWLTHAHPDHCGACKQLQRETGASIAGSNHWMERAMRWSGPAISAVYGIKDTGFRSCPAPDEVIKKGDTLSLGNLKFSVLHTPGHAPGHLSFYCADAGILLAGDLFFGRFDYEAEGHTFSLAPTSYPGGNKGVLVDTVEDVLELPSHTLIFSGHRDDFTIETARAHQQKLFATG